jgi:hypothetical protein
MSLPVEIKNTVLVVGNNEAIAERHVATHSSLATCFTLYPPVTDRFTRRLVSGKTYCLNTCEYALCTRALTRLFDSPLTRKMRMSKRVVNSISTFD